jgi:hypothetical protein
MLENCLYKALDIRTSLISSDASCRRRVMMNFIGTMLIVSVILMSKAAAATSVSTC